VQERMPTGSAGRKTSHNSGPLKEIAREGDRASPSWLGQRDKKQSPDAVLAVQSSFSDDYNLLLTQLPSKDNEI
jgi:hypothetical protein